MQRMSLLLQQTALRIQVKLFHIASNNIEGGQMASDYIRELVGEGANVAELEGIPGSSAARERGKGFHNIADKSLKSSC